MQGPLSIGLTLVTLLLAINPINADINGYLQFYDLSVGSKTCRGCTECHVNMMIPGWCTESPVMGNDFCVNLNGRISQSACGGTLTVDFPPEPTDQTPMHFTAANGSYVGGTAGGKQTPSSTKITDLGTGQWGSSDYVGDWCVANIIQHQKKNPSAAATDADAQYSYNISLFDNSQPTRKWIGGALLYSASGQSNGTDSLLPSVFMITSGKIDSDPYSMSYNNPYLPSPSNQIFNAYDTAHQCSLANVFPNGGKGNQWAYDSGARTNNCGFQC